MFCFVFFVLFTTLSKYADNNNLFTAGTDIKLIKQMLSSSFRTINNWFYENFIILNPGKCHFMSINKDTHDEDLFQYDNLAIRKSNEQEVLRITINRKLTFHQHIEKIYRKTGQKLSVLIKIFHVP